MVAGGRVISALRSDWLMAPQSARTLYVSETYFCPNVNSIIREKKGGERERKGVEGREEKVNFDYISAE